MDYENTHAFIVRVWTEPREIKTAVPGWRGFVEQVSSGERRYFEDLIDAAAHIREFLSRDRVIERDD